MATITSNLELTKPEEYDNITPVIFAENFDTIDKAVGLTLVGTLPAGSTDISFSDPRIPDNAIIDIYTSVDGLDKESISCTPGYIIITFPAQDTNTTVVVKVGCY